MIINEDSPMSKEMIPWLKVLKTPYGVVSLSPPMKILIMLGTICFKLKII